MTHKIVYDRDTVLDATNRGQEIIMRLCDKAFKGTNLKPQHFILNEGDENTASCIPYFTGGPDGVWIVNSFGASPTLDVFELIQEKVPEVNSFRESLQWAYREFNIIGGSTKFNSGKIEFKPATKKQKDGQYFYDYKKKLSEFELSTLGKLVDQDVCDFYNVKSVKSFTQIKTYEEGDKGFSKYGATPQQIITHSSEAYPIYVIDTGEWQKIYQPLNRDKGFRFRYAPKGHKSSSHIFGLEQTKSQLEDHRNNYDYEKGEDREDVKLPYLLIGGGDRDSLNIAGAGFPVVWFNSETATIDFETFSMFKELAHKVVYVGDIDATGIKEMHEKALQLVDLCILELPSFIKTMQYRGKPRKDVKDYFDLLYNPKKPKKVKNSFDKLVRNSLPAKFWEEKYNNNGDFRGYHINNEAVFNFLRYNGFYRIEETHSKEDYSFVRIRDSIVSRKSVHHVSDFAYYWLKERSQPIGLINTVIRSAQLGEKKLSKLEIMELNLKNSGPDFQYLFFEKNVWRVTGEKIEVMRYGSGNLDVHVWEDKIITQTPTYNKAPFFTITQKEGVYDIDILKRNHFFNFLINSSRVHWRVLGNSPFLQRKDNIDTLDPKEQRKQLREIEKDYEAYHRKNRFEIAEKGLEPPYVQEQKLHLISKIYLLGYLMHTYKSPSKAWQVHAMDSRISETGKSNGGSGKSLVFNVCLRSLVPRTHFIDGKDLDPQKDSFVYDGVDRDTDLVVADDLNQKYPLTKFFPKVTGDFTVNPKGVSAFKLKFEESPKIITTSNYGISKVDGSTKRRIMYWVASDYYHGEDESCFKLEHQPHEDLGLELINDFDAAEYSSFINFMAQCLQFYLSTKKPIRAPEGNIVKRNALQSMGDAFFNWAEIYFSPTENGEPSPALNMYIPKKDLLESCKKGTEYTRLTSQSFKNKLEQWCKYKGFVLNPRKLLNKQKFIKKKYMGTTREFYYIRTPNTLPKGWNAEHVYDTAFKDDDGLDTVAEIEEMMKNPKMDFKDKEDINPKDDDFPS